MNNAMLIAGAIGFAPAMILMFWTLRDYTYPKVEKPFFEDKKAFGLFAVGMVIGVIIYSAQSWFALDLVLIALLFALVEELVKLMILNFSRFQRKLDTSFYGRGQKQEDYHDKHDYNNESASNTRATPIGHI